MIRAILALLFAVLYLILGIPVLFAEWIIRKCNRHAADISSLRMVQWAFRVIMFICGVKLTVIGEENVPKDVPVLYIGNHRHYYHLFQMSETHRLHCQRHHGKSSSFKHLDEAALLPLLRPYRYEEGLKNHPDRYRPD